MNYDRNELEAAYPWPDSMQNFCEFGGTYEETGRYLTRCVFHYLKVNPDAAAVAKVTHRFEKATLDFIRSLVDGATEQQIYLAVLHGWKAHTTGSWEAYSKELSCSE